MPVHEIDGERPEPSAAEYNRCGYAHVASHRRFRPGRAARRLHFLEDPRALDEEALTDIGQRNAPCRAVQQPNAKPVLERLHMLAGSGLGNPEFAGGPGETSGARYLGEYGHARKPVHYYHPPGERIPIVPLASNSIL
jgi:hypothetical protein